MASPHVGLVGCGRWGRNILRDLLTLGSDVWVADHDDAARDAARQAGARAVVDHADDLPPLDAVIVATPARTHAAVIEELLPRAIPLFCEKPLSPDPHSAQRLAALAPDRLFVMHKWRYHPGIEALGSLARAGELGEITGLRTTRTSWGHPPADVDPIWALAPHDLSIALEVLGHVPHPVAAMAEGRPGRPEGLIALLDEEATMVMDVSIRRPEWRRRVELYCAEGVAVLSHPEADHIEVTCGDPAAATHERRLIPTELPLVRELRAFLDHLAGGSAPRSSAAEGAAVDTAVAELRRLAGLEAPQ